MEVKTFPNKQAIETQSGQIKRKVKYHGSAFLGDMRGACRLVMRFFYLCLCFTDCKETGVLLIYDRCVHCISSHETILTSLYHLYRVCSFPKIKKALPYPETPPDMFRVMYVKIWYV